MKVCQAAHTPLGRVARLLRPFRTSKSQSPSTAHYKAQRSALGHMDQNSLVIWNNSDLFPIPKTPILQNNGSDCIAVRLQIRKPLGKPFADKMMHLVISKKKSRLVDSVWGCVCLDGSIGSRPNPRTATFYVNISTLLFCATFVFNEFFGKNVDWLT